MDVSHEGSGVDDGGGGGGAIEDRQREQKRNVSSADRIATVFPACTVSTGAESSRSSDGANLAAEGVRGSAGGQAAGGSETPRQQWKGVGEEEGRKAVAGWGRGEAQRMQIEVSWLDLDRAFNSGGLVGPSY